MSEVDCKTITPGAFPHEVKIRSHTFRTDVSKAGGGEDSSPSPHDYFDASLAACKALTAMVYAKKHGIPLESVETHVESDASQERAGVYKLKSKVTFHGPMTDEQREKLHRAVGACPLHKLMTTVDVQIETVE